MQECTMAAHNGVWMRRIAKGINIMMLILTVLMLALMWSDVYSAYYDPTYPIGMAEGGWRYHTKLHVLYATFADSLILLASLGYLLWVQRARFYLVVTILLSLASPSIFIVHLWLDDERRYLGGFLMNIFESKGF